jgi:hypothetical protein
MNERQERIVRLAIEVFRADVSHDPTTTLRGGDSLDDYERPPPYDLVIDEPTAEYLEKYAYYGLFHLDPASWRHYLPHLIDYALRHYSLCDVSAACGLAIGGLLGSLRPPDRDPPRLASLSAAQEQVLVAFLDVLAFDEESQWQNEALPLLEGYWAPEALQQRT